MRAEASSAADFDRRYREDPDPWGYESSAYERAKYAHTLAAVPAGPIPAALELGCSIGAFTERLAERCESLLAVDFSPEAVRLARDRTRGLAGVAVEQRDLRAGLPRGPFDLILCSEVLYYLRRDEVASCIEAIEHELRPGGTLIAVNWRGSAADAPTDGATVDAMLDGSGLLRRSRDERHHGYLLGRWERAS